MRLLNTSTIRLESFYEEATTPSYAILSHTWGDDEVSFQDLEYVTAHPESMHARSILLSQGFYKIRGCCESALATGLQYAWIDTCCIDKTSSAELSESINSMFKWYKNAAICYAYLDDIDSSVARRPSSQASSTNNDSKRYWQGGENLNKFYMATARWFTRGWTLQELIAPGEVVFYAQGWRYLDLKTRILDILEHITGVDPQSLLGYNLERVSVAQRMSWASKRETTRSEDTAYCLLGIFDVNMPLLYGEGEKAFVRLQEEIMKNSDDQSLFAWAPVNKSEAIWDDEMYDASEGASTADLRSDPSPSPSDLDGFMTDSKWSVDKPMADGQTRGIFATHPSEFCIPSVLSRVPAVGVETLEKMFNSEAPYMLTNKGVEIWLPILLLNPANNLYLAVLSCSEYGKEDLLLSIVVQSTHLSPTRLYRREGCQLVRVKSEDLLRGARLEKVYLSKKPYVSESG